MKSFLVKTTCFIVLIISLVIGLIVLSDYAVNQRKDQLLKIRDDINIVFAGNSSVECAVDDKIVKNSLNIAQSGEAYFYMYAKIKSLIESNSHINTIFIGFAYGDLLMEKEESWLFSDEFVIEKIQYYNYLLSGPDRALIFKNNPESYLKGLTKSVFNNFEAFLASFTQDTGGPIINFGGYKHLIRDKLQEAVIKELNNEPLAVKSHFQEEYLRRISELCHQKSVRLVLFNTPKHKYYITNVNNNIKQIWTSVRNSLSQDSLLDLSTLSLPDSCFGDLTHLNYKGADVFSKYLNDKIIPDISEPIIN